MTDHDAWDESGVDEDVKASDGFKNLRDAYRNQGRELKAANDRLTALETEKRNDSLSAALKSRGVSEQAAKFYPSDVEVSDAAVEKWLSENSDVFAPKATEVAPAVEAADAEAQRKVAQVTNTAPVPTTAGFDDAVSRLRGLDVHASDFESKLHEVLSAAAG